MKSLRVKLIVAVALVSLLGLGTVVFSSLGIVRQASREQTEATNRQLSDLVSRSVLGQLSDYRRQMEIAFNNYIKQPDFHFDGQVFPDFLWITMIDVTNKPLFEWAKSDFLAEKGLSVEELIGFKKKIELADEVRSLYAAKDQWIIFNSSVNALFPTFVLGTTFSSDETLQRRYVVLGEIYAERMYRSIRSRPGQELLLVDSHQNLLLSTRDAWDPSLLNLDDSQLIKIIKDLNEGESKFSTLEYSKRPPQATSVYKFREGGGLSLILQEPLSQLEASAELIQWRALIIVLIVMIIMVNLLILLGHHIISPLSDLAKLMERVGKGDFSIDNKSLKVSSKRVDEIGRLATVFKKMLGDLKEREVEIERAKGRLVQSEKMSAFGQMSAGIAHEVKNPLAGILGYSQMTKKKLPADSEVLPYIDIIEKETLRCKEIVDNLMRFARQEKAVMARIDINKTVKDSIRLVEHQMSISGIKMVQIYALDGAPIWLTGNANQIQQVMMNLMLNAQQAMENKGTLTITTHFEAEQKRVLILVSDTGSGMPEDVKMRIFEPFYTTKGVGKGTGLGLSVSLGIIKDHGGIIDVESEVGKGTTFNISLPLADAEQQGAGSAAA